MKKFEEEKAEEVTNSKKTKVVPSMPVPKPLFGGFSSFIGPAKPMSVPARKVESKPADKLVSKPEEKPTTPATVSKTERMKTQSNAEANKPTETPKPVSRPTETPKPMVPSNYKTYKSSSKEASDFRSNFAKARKSGAKEFTWEGRKYNTKVKGE